MNQLVEFADVSKEFFAPVDEDLIDELLTQYQNMRVKIKDLADIFESTTGEAVKYFFDGCKDDRTRLASIERIFVLDNAVAALNSKYWSKALELTDVYNAMPQKRRDEWNESIRNQTTPEFTSDAVRPTISTLLASRHTFFAERVDGIFRSLSGEHVTNSPAGFSKRMILSHVTDNFSFTNSSQCGSINDLRCVIAKFMGRDEPRWSSSTSLVSSARHDHGEWVLVDGGALRIRVYMKGTAHIEVHPDIAYKLNQVLAWMHPMAIPSEFRKKPVKKHKEFTMTERPLPFAVLDILSDLRRSGRTNDFFVSANLNRSKHVDAEVFRVLESIGGVVKTGRTVSFDYDPIRIIERIISSGCLPDQQTHQYYPTPEEVAKLAVEMTDIQDSDTVLEPSAGQGAIAEHLPKDRTKCIEISDLHCDILKARGFDVERADFIEWSVSADKVDCIVMNPPYSEGRWRQHIKCAYSMLKPNGRMVAVLPTSALSNEFILSTRHEFSRVLNNKFDGTSISVVIVKITRPSVL